VAVYIDPIMPAFEAKMLSTTESDFGVEILQGLSDPGDSTDSTPVQRIIPLARNASPQLTPTGRTHRDFIAETPRVRDTDRRRTLRTMDWIQNTLDDEGIDIFTGLCIFDLLTVQSPNFPMGGESARILLGILNPKSWAIGEQAIIERARNLILQRYFGDDDDEVPTSEAEEIELAHGLESM
jgi:hypothetical protein